MSAKVHLEDTLEQKERTETPDFETAISASGFGKFNLLLILVAIPSGWASMFESSTISYIIPVAECDLDLSLEDKGYLISATYLGMFSSSILWGFLSDTLGRKKILVIGLFLTSFFTFVAGIAQTYTMLIFAKFMGGFITNGPFAVLTTVLSEYHSAKFRASILLLMGVVFSLANVVLPLLAWSLLPSALEITLFDGVINLHTWNLFILITGLSSLLGAVGHLLFIPESPKFLMTNGRNEEALHVFQYIHAMNTGKAPSTFPYTQLINEATSNHSAIAGNKLGTFRYRLAQMKQFYRLPHVTKLILVCALQMGTLTGLNSLRLWLPQLFTATYDYKALHPNEDSNICRVLANMLPNETVSVNVPEPICEFPEDSSGGYVNLIIISCVSIVCYTMVGFLVNALGKKRLFIILTFISGAFGFSIFFTTDPVMLTILSGLCISLAGISTNVLLAVTVDLFPTTLRTMAVCVSLMVGRFGAMMGNMIIPHLIQSGCLWPFLFLGSAIISCSFIAFLLPNTDQKALQ